MKLPLFLAALPLLLSTSQEPDIAQAWRELHDQLDAGESADAERTLDRAARIALLDGFVEQWNREDRAGRPELLAARIRLGSLYLAGLDAAAALTQFTAILSAAPEDALDARGRALYGKAQALLLLDRNRPGRGEQDRGKPDYGKQARAALDELRREFVGTRWATQALIALKHLSDNADEQARIGQPAPEIGPRLDRLGKPRSLGELRGEPVLLLFLSPFDEAGLDAVERWVDRAREAGLPAEQILAFGVGAETPELNELVRQRGAPGLLFATPAGFLDPVLLDYRIRSLPSSALIGPDGMLLARDLPPARLRRALGELLR